MFHTYPRAFALAIAFFSVLVIQTNQTFAQGAYPIKNVASGLLVDVIGGQTNDRQGVILFPANNLPHQRFIMAIVQGDEFELRPDHAPRKCLEVMDSSTRNGGFVVQYACHGGPNQRWTINRVGNVKTIRNVLSGKCMDAGNANFPTPPKSEAVIQQWDCITRQDARNAVNQVFTIGGN